MCRFGWMDLLYHLYRLYRWIHLLNLSNSVGIHVTYVYRYANFSQYP